MSWHKKRIGSHLQIFEVFIFHVKGKLLLILEVGHSNQSLMKLKVDDEETEATNPLS